MSIFALFRDSSACLNGGTIWLSWSLIALVLRYLSKDRLDAHPWDQFYGGKIFKCKNINH